jgi:hypothetical protein
MCGKCENCKCIEDTGVSCARVGCTTRVLLEAVKAEKHADCTLHVPCEDCVYFYANEASGGVDICNIFE